MRNVLLTSLFLFSFTPAVFAQPQNVTYQGELKQSGALADGSFFMQFSLYDAETGGTAMEISETPIGPVSVVDGRFSTELTFDSSNFDGSERWIEVAVDGDTLSPRQKINPTPNSIYSNQTRGIVVDFFGNAAVGTESATDNARLLVEGGMGLQTVVDSSVATAFRAANLLGGQAGQFDGDVDVAGNLSKSAGTFKIDHPLDPANKFLYHSFVESAEMMNIYNGNVRTDRNGYATVVMPEWFEALNRDFRYQLTVVDEADSDSFVLAKIVQKIDGNQFRLRTSEPNSSVSWQVTGVRQDAYAEANRVQVEVDKPVNLKGRYIHPELFGFDQNRKLGAAFNHKSER